MLMTLISRLDIRPNCVEIRVRRSRLVELLGSGSINFRASYSFEFGGFPSPNS